MHAKHARINRFMVRQENIQMHQRMPRRQALAAAVAAFAAATTVSACAGESQPGISDEEPSSPAKRPKPGEPARHASDESFPVGEPFGEAAWSIGEVRDSSDTAAVRGDRLIIHREVYPKSVTSYAPDGSEVWYFDLPGRGDPDIYDVQILDEVVAILTRAEVDGEGLEESSFVAKVLLLSIQDGSVVTETDLPIEDSHAFPPANLIGDGVYMTEGGELRDIPAENTTPKFIDGVPVWTEAGDSGNGEVLSAENWQGLEYSFAERKEVVNRERGLVLVDEPDTDDESLVGHILNIHTGDVLFSITSETNAFAEHEVGRYWSPVGDGESSVCSPSGEFSVSGALWISESEGRCIGGGDGQQNVTLTAVDDAGTAYGISEESKLVTVPAGGEAQVSDLPEVGAPNTPSPPFAIMDGGLALHWDGLTVTANPIR